MAAGAGAVVDIVFAIERKKKKDRRNFFQKPEQERRIFFPQDEESDNIGARKPSHSHDMANRRQRMRRSVVFVRRLKRRRNVVDVRCILATWSVRGRIGKSTNLLACGKW